MSTTVIDIYHLSFLLSHNTFINGSCTIIICPWSIYQN